MVVGARNVVPSADDGGVHLKSVGSGQPVRAVLLDDQDARAGDERVGQTAEGADGVGVDLIEAHKWFNIAAVTGDSRAQECRAEIAEDMTAREIIEAQKAARAWLRGFEVRAA